nr:hypothetical protein [Tanacetum cinerariifolium]
LGVLGGDTCEVTYSLQPGVLGGDTCEGYIFIFSWVFLEGTPMMGTHGFHYCTSVLGGDTYDGNAPGQYFAATHNFRGVTLESRSDKESPEVEITADVQPVSINDAEEESAEDDYELRSREKGKHVEEIRNKTSPKKLDLLVFILISYPQIIRNSKN